jgi:molybdenum cofactor synthesis domain-containing protein
LPDDRLQLSGYLHELLRGVNPQFIVTTGGTGLSDRDITPETVRAVALEWGGREIPGIGEFLRSSGSLKNEYAWLSRTTAFLVRHTLILALPGSPKAVIESLDAIGPLLKHVVHTAHGGTHAKV